MPDAHLTILSGGAAQALVGKLQPDFHRTDGISVGGSFGAVGAMKEKFLRGEPCDLLVLTEAIIGELSRDGHILDGWCAPIGKVRTGVAVPAGAPAPSIGDRKALHRTFQEATGLYFPDPEKATAGIHVMKMLRALDLEAELASRLRPFPNGATAMGALAASGDPTAVGCTQVTEILATPGVRLAGPLPNEFELVTSYMAAVPTCSRRADAARRFAQLLAGPESGAVRTECGFE